jgi:hypothetical protein
LQADLAEQQALFGKYREEDEQPVPEWLADLAEEFDLHKASGKHLEVLKEPEQGVQRRFNEIAEEY